MPKIGIYYGYDPCWGSKETLSVRTGKYSPQGTHRRSETVKLSFLQVVAPAGGLAERRKHGVLAEI